MDMPSADPVAREVVEQPEAVGPVPLPLRLGAALPHVVAAGYLLVVFVGYIGGEIRLTSEIRDASGWLMYELLACVYASVLPLGMIVASFLGRLLSRPGSRRILDGSLVLLLPFALFAWNMAPAGAARWGVLAFLGLAFARWLPHRHEAAVARDGIRAVVGSAKRAVRVWTCFTAAFFLSAFLILPLEPLLGLEMPSVDHGQYFMILGMGIVYFALNAVVEIFNLTRRLMPTQTRLRSPLADRPEQRRAA